MVKKDILDRSDISRLLSEFYALALVDPVIGHFFTEVIKLDLEKHMPVITDFWESVLLDSANYRGNPIQKHLDLNAMSQIKKVHFDRWLALFDQCVDSMFDGAIANLAKTRALSIATMMQIKIAQQKAE